MKFLGNEVGTKNWTELDRSFISGLVTQSTDDPATRQQVRDWLRDAGHGDVMVLGAVRIVAVDIEDG